MAGGGGGGGEDSKGRGRGVKHGRPGEPGPVFPRFVSA